MAASRAAKQSVPPEETRFRAPLHVVVEKYDDGGARVRGDVSKEVLRDMLMSSLMLVPGSRAAGVESKLLAGRSLVDAEYRGTGTVEDGRGAAGKQAEELASEARRAIASGRVRPPYSRSTALFADKGSRYSRKKFVDEAGREFYADEAGKGTRYARKKFVDEAGREFYADEADKGARYARKKFADGAGREFYEGELREGEYVPGFSDSEGQSLGRLDAEADEKSAPSCPSTATDDLNLSHDALWLRSHFDHPLRSAMREIVSRKPSDPVAYLGFWLLNYRKTQERAEFRKEFERDLSHLRATVNAPMFEEEEEARVHRDEGEESCPADVDFAGYDSQQVVA